MCLLFILCVDLQKENNQDEPSNNSYKDFVVNLKENIKECLFKGTPRQID